VLRSLGAPHQKANAMTSIQTYRRFFRAAVIAFCFCCGMAAFSGCERKERVLDVETPEGELEVDRNIDTGEVEVNVTDKD
jgi:hypothetical protein